jgi:predicted alpha/beta superfamily hydrolase
MKKILTSILLCISVVFFGQNLTTIKISVPNKTDEVYIVGNQESLGNWQPNKVKMNVISEFEREITLDLSFPAEYKFTRGNWNSEAVINKLSGQPNFILQQKPANFEYHKIHGWTDQIDKFSTFSDFKIVNLNSKVLNQNRKLYIALPENYSEKIKYPVIYITDAQNINNFEIAFQTLRQQANFNTFPKCILVGIYQNERNNELDRNFTEKGKKFKDFIFTEVINFVNSNYSTASFKAIIGHSDGAEYNHYLMFENNNPFDAFINISEEVKLSFDGNKNSVEILSKFDHFIKNNSKPIKYFVASGKYDFWHRYEAGLKIDSVFNQNKSDKIAFEHKIYFAEHNELVAKSMLDGLEFVFHDYRNFEILNNALQTEKFDYLKTKETILNKTKKYSPNYQFNEEDYTIIDDLISSKKNFSFYQQYLDAENKNYESIPRLSIARQYYFLGEYEKSLALFNEILAINDKDSFSYFQTNFTPAIDIFVKINKNPKGAIDFLNVCKNKMPENNLIFSFYIAKIGIENNVDKKLALSNLKYCEQNFTENRMFTFEDIEKLKKITINRK